VKLGGHHILRDINLHLHCGEMTVLIGPNGAGKSMLLRALLDDVKQHRARSASCPRRRAATPRPSSATCRSTSTLIVTYR